MTRARRRWVSRAVAVALGAALIVAGWANRSRFSPADAGTAAPTYRAATLDGDTLALADLRGRVVLLNVWATWCPPCVREMPALQRLYDRYHERGLEVVAVSVDTQLPGTSGTSRIAGFVNDLGLTFRILHDPTGTVERTFNVPALPVTIVITRDGHIHERVLGERAWDEPPYAAQIEKLLAD